MDDGYEKTLFDDDKHEFDNYLPLKQRNIKLFDDDVDVNNRNTSYVKLYFCFDILEKYRVTEMKNGPLNYEDLLEHVRFFYYSNTFFTHIRFLLTLIFFLNLNSVCRCIYTW